MATLAPPNPSFAGRRRTAARVALFDLPENSQNLLADCFRQFGIDTTQFAWEQLKRIQKEKFEACVLALGPLAGEVIELARTSNSNSRIVIYGLGGTARDALRYSKLCLNAVFQEPLERPEAVKLVRATRSLILHEFHRYVRIPVMTEVRVVMADGGRLSATSQEISCGGMSLKGTHAPEIGSPVEVSFSLLTLPRVWLRGSVAWKKTNKTFGVRFDANDHRRQRVKDWLTAYFDS